MDYLDYKHGVQKKHFWFKGREELIKILLSKLDIGSNSKILSVGTGTGSELKILKDFGEIYALDVDNKILDLLPLELCKEIRMENICYAKFPNNYFRLITLFDVLEHIKDDDLAISKIKHLLEPKGYIIITVPAFQSMYSKHDVALKHFRRYSFFSLKWKASNFKCTKIGFWCFSLFLPIFFFRLVNKISIKFTVKEKSLTSEASIRIPKILNNIAYCMLRVDNFCIKHNIMLPFGLTIYGIFQKS